MFVCFLSVLCVLDPYCPLHSLVWQNLLNDGCLLNATSLVSLSGFLENCSTHLSHCNVVDRVAYASDLCSSTFVDLMKQSIANIRIKQWRALLAVRQGHKHNTSLLFQVKDNCLQEHACHSQSKKHLYFLKVVKNRFIYLFLCWVGHSSTFTQIYCKPELTLLLMLFSYSYMFFCIIIFLVLKRNV